MSFRPDRWLYGLPALALIWVIAMAVVTPRIERELRRDLAGTPPEDAAVAAARPRPEVDGRDVVIVTEPNDDEAARRQAEAAARNVEGVRSVRTEVAASAPMTPFRLTIERGPNGIAFAGGVPSAALRAILVGEAAAIVGAPAVDDKLRPATGEPGDLTVAARFLLAALSHVTSGETAVTDRALSFRGEASGSDAYKAALAALAAPPAGYTIGQVDLLPPKLDPYRWIAERRAGEIAFGGAVPSETLRADLLARARARFGALAVVDEMETARGLDPAIDFAAMSEAALAALARLETGRIALEGRRASVSGEGVAKDRLATLDAELRRALPGRVELSPAEIRIVPASPFVFEARRGGGRIVLSGFVADETERRAARELATSRFIGDSLVDDLAVADGAPPRFGDALRLSLTSLSELAEGSATLRDAAFSLDGRSLYRQAAERSRQALPRAVPAGWTAAVAIRAEPVERPLEASLCVDLLADAVRRDPIRFEPGTAHLAPAAKAGLDAAAGLVGRCGSARIKVVYHLAGAVPDAAGIAARRAAAIVTALSGRAPDARLASDGQVGETASTAAGGTPIDVGRTEFVVTP